jgi:cobalt/nickel transport system permease protein
MHIPDGILPTTAVAAGYVAAIPVTWYSIRKINQKENPRQDIPKTSLLTAAFFVVSWIHIPIPPASVHLVLNGLMGALLGYFAFPAILIGLFFQAIMFQHGGLTTLGINSIIMGLPALLSYYIFRLRKTVKKENKITIGILGFFAGFVGIAISALLYAVIILTTISTGIDIQTERAAIYGLTLAHLPLAAIEGAFSAMVTVFLHKVQPKLLGS